METTTKPTAVTAYFCTYRNAETKGAWHKSREYSSVAELLNAMSSYLTENPRTLVQYQSKTSWF